MGGVGGVVGMASFGGILYGDMGNSPSTGTMGGFSKESHSATITNRGMLLSSFTDTDDA